MGETAIRSAGGDDLDAPTLYDLLRLRAEVFVVEQASPYLDPDGRDLQPDTRHLWVEENGTIVAALRVVREPTGVYRIGRVVAAKRARGRGLAAELMRAAIVVIGDDPVVLDAQAHLEEWYRRMGFVRTGPVFDEDGIAHVPMRRR